MPNETVVGTFRVRAGAEAEFTALLGRHWRTLHRRAPTSTEFPHYQHVNLSA